MLPRTVAFFRPTNQEVACSNHAGRTIRFTFSLPNGKPKVRSWQAIRLVECPERRAAWRSRGARSRRASLIAGHPHVECPERLIGWPRATQIASRRASAHGEPFDTSNATSSIHFHCSADDGIVVGMWFVYILRCSDGSLYIGETDDIAQRVADHNRGRGSSHTAKYRPVQLAYAEQHANRVQCLEREQQLKGWTRAKKEALIVGDLKALKRL